MPKIAIFHDFIDSIGGGEIVVLTLARALDADIIAFSSDKDLVKKMGFGDINIVNLGKTRINIPHIKQIAASYKFARCDFRDKNKYDFFVISGNFSVNAAKKHKPNLWYCHTPLRGIYDLKSYFESRSRLRLIEKIPRNIFRYFDQKAVRHMDSIIANSKNIQKRIKKYYDRQSRIIYPPIETRKFRYRKNGNFWLSVNRIDPIKRIDLQIETFRCLPEERLVIIGGCEPEYSKDAYARKLAENLPENVTFLGNVSEERLAGLYSDCKAFITTAIDEDFGMTPVEAMSSGKPVVAVNEGGYRETVINNVTGRLVKADISSLVSAVSEISKDPARYRDACEKRAKYFDAKIFIEKMKKEIINEQR